MHEPGEAAAESTVSQAQSHRLPLKSPAGFTNPRRQNSTPGVPVMLTAQKELSETAPGASGSEQIGRVTCGSNVLVLGRERPAQLAEPEENHNQAQGETSALPTPDPGGGTGLPAFPFGWAAKHSFDLTLVLRVASLPQYLEVFVMALPLQDQHPVL